MVLGITKIIILAYLQMSKKGVVYTYLIFIFQKIICESQSCFPMLFVKIGGKMNIAFWSMTSGRSATSSNMLAVGAMSALAYSVEGTLLQLDQFSMSLDEAFGERRQTNLLMEEYSYYSKKGIDRLVDKAQLEDINIDDLKDNAVPVKDTNMNYVPASKRVGLGNSSREMQLFVRKVFDVLDKEKEFNFIDCENGEIAISKAILKSADVVVINLCQGMSLDTLDLDKEILKKAVFLVGKYDDASKEDVTQIRRKYGIGRGDIATIPYNIRFHDAIHEGKLLAYISKNMNTKINDDNLSFINSVFLATDMILRKAGYDERSR